MPGVLARCGCRVIAPAPLALVNVLLAQKHYLGPTRRGFALSDEGGALVLALPTSRRLPSDGTWLELSRWCIVGPKNTGSRQWAQAVEWLRRFRPETTTVVSYSDPSAGHSGALYRACNWLWAPTWHRLVPPPSGNGRWGVSGSESVKDRWVYPLREDARRVALLSLEESYERRFPGAGWREPKLRRGVPVGGTGGGDYARCARRLSVAAVHTLA